MVMVPNLWRHSYCCYDVLRMHISGFFFFVCCSTSFYPIFFNSWRAIKHDEWPYTQNSQFINTNHILFHVYYDRKTNVWRIFLSWVIPHDYITLSFYLPKTWVKKIKRKLAQWKKRNSTAEFLKFKIEGKYDSYKRQ